VPPQAAQQPEPVPHDQTGHDFDDEDDDDPTDSGDRFLLDEMMRAE
jgi:hypothetical protein